MSASRRAVFSLRASPLPHRRHAPAERRNAAGRRCACACACRAHAVAPLRRPGLGGGHGRGRVAAATCRGGWPRRDCRAGTPALRRMAARDESSRCLRCRRHATGRCVRSRRTPARGRLSSGARPPGQPALGPFAASGSAPGVSPPRAAPGASHGRWSMGAGRPQARPALPSVPLTAPLGWVCSLARANPRFQAQAHRLRTANVDAWAAGAGAREGRPPG